MVVDCLLKFFDILRSRLVTHDFCDTDCIEYRCQLQLKVIYKRTLSGDASEHSVNEESLFTGDQHQFLKLDSF